MKKILLLLMLLNVKDNYAISNPLTWNNKKHYTVNLATDFIANREAFSNTCYEDGHGFSIGYGDFSYCKEGIKNLKKNNKIYYGKSNEELKSFVKITKEQARWRLRKFIIETYDRLETYEIQIDKTQINIVETLDVKQLVSLLDNIYTRGETNFYKSNLWKDIVINYVAYNKIDCYKTAHEFLSQSKRSKYKQRNGVLARRLVELLDFTHKNCVYDIKFLNKIENKYKVK